MKELTSELRAKNQELERLRAVNERQTRAIALLNSALRAKEAGAEQTVNELRDTMDVLVCDNGEFKHFNRSVGFKLDVILALLRPPAP